MIMISDAFNNLLLSTQGVKALLHAAHFARNAAYQIPMESLLVLTSVNLFRGNSFMDESAETFCKAALPQRQFALSAQALKLVCPKCKCPVRVIPNPLEPWIHVQRSCGMLVTSQNIFLETDRADVLEGVEA